MIKERYHGTWVEDGIAICDSYLDVYLDESGEMWGIVHGRPFVALSIDDGIISGWSPTLEFVVDNDV